MALADGGIDLGTFDGVDRQGRQGAQFKVDVRLSDARFDAASGEHHVDLELRVRYPAKEDRTVSAELPLHAVENLRDELGGIVEGARQDRGGA